MTKIERFEDIEAWKKGRELTKAIYEITSKGSLARDFALRDQMRRASVSIMSNIAEGFERNGNREFEHFLAMAKGSTGEIKAQLYVALDAEYISEEVFDGLYADADHMGRLIGGLMKYLSTSDYRGNRFKESSVPYFMVEDGYVDPENSEL